MFGKLPKRIIFCVCLFFFHQLSQVKFIMHNICLYIRPRRYIIANDSINHVAYLIQTSAITKLQMLLLSIQFTKFWTLYVFISFTILFTLLYFVFLFNPFFAHHIVLYCTFTIYVSIVYFFSSIISKNIIPIVIYLLYISINLSNIHLQKNLNVFLKNHI